MTTLGFVVLAKRPRDWGYEYKVVKMRNRSTGVVFTGPNALEQAQNAQEYCQKRDRTRAAICRMESDAEFVIGEIVPVQR